MRKLAVNREPLLTEQVNSGVICLVGGSGFVGSHIINSELTPHDSICHVLSRRSDALGPIAERKRVRMFSGDLCHPFIEQGFIVPDATVVNLAYLSGDDVGENTTAINYLIDKCIDEGAKRLIHCSTAVVAGDVAENEIDENTVCHPVTAYERCKMAIEMQLVEKCRKRLDLIILRPTAVFGVGGKNLNSTIDFVVNCNAWQRKLRMSVFKTRQMNLISVENVVAAIHFLAGIEHEVGVRRYIVSEDDDPSNTFGEVCRIIHAVSKKSAPKTLPIPFNRSIQRMFLRVLHGPSVVPDRFYIGRRLAAEGFRLPFTFRDRVRDYAFDYLQKSANTL